MSSSTNAPVKIAAVLLMGLSAAASLGQDNAPPPRPSPPAEAEAERPAEPPPPAAERPDVNDEEFIPTEELNPDAAVTFPVDI
jgi:hypothetical protein